MKANKNLTVNAAVITLVTFLISGVSYAASEEDSTNQMALQKIMQQLGHDMQEVTGSISKEDWDSVAEIAPRIADHAQPPLGEKMRILAWLGNNAGTFRTLDKEVHDAAMKMRDAATQAEGQDVIAAFAELQQACLVCHQDFRQSFRDRFYE
ncbi:MAG: cytochrome c [Marinobacter sp.]|uniref:cytochrome c n=1 Tax=Marinobacter sp. TaxID=50741 RepID=UPI00396D4B87